jgi:putative ABC transport system permease protein
VSFPATAIGFGRVHLATRTLLNDRVRLAISLGGIAFAILLMLLLRGIMDGTVARSTRYIDNVGADVFVAREGVEYMSLATSALPSAILDDFAAVPGVRDRAGIVRFPLIISNAGADMPATAIGFVPGQMGGPWALASGRAVDRRGEAVVDGQLAADLGLVLGDEVTVLGQPFTVVGLSAETSAIAGKLFFVALDDLRAITGTEDQFSFILLQVEPGVDPESIVAIVNAIPGLNAMTRDTLSSNDRRLLRDLFVSPIDVMSTAGFLVGMAIVGLTMYTTTAERLRDFGVLKAIGAPNGFLFRTVAVQSLVLCLGGYVLGFAAAEVAGPLIQRTVPDIGVTVTMDNALRALVAVVIMSLAGGLVPIARILRVDPLMVFRR